MLELIVSGGQSGSDLAGWKAARAASIPTSGWMPARFMTEDGPRPEYAGMYRAKEHESPNYPPRTRANVLMSDATIIFAAKDSVGSKLTWDICEKANKPFRYIIVQSIGPEKYRVHPAGIEAKEVAEWIREKGFTSINIAGNRESKSPGIGAFVGHYMGEVFRLLGHAAQQED